ncbi:UDP-N-acetylmuramoyl-tripeptide--D-alanyl-D-alanine ligase [Thalassotalea euphylliae]|uniref:UDP-N-acetylmuramoyl-tripeptide--D-alanyl-D-alanine ligase n=1 Tax=Thalassotalea euphylliae TaxID=1655234 RepID=A0A3E0TUF9_9GAMM|nr:UDP-N-acetylmuramoyl-tripeptide--D-alanyl-D-alanine ligase [Thalassotalea euphylliae]REL28074.1 UDP-N-acetylmuramoyl-tripeptide--D-alanyl-D-alanine ligase [Thalassotalea euphylliae]
MIPLTLSEIATATGGELIGENITINAISTDSRALASEQVFLALKGPNFDGHKFVEQVAELGGVAVIVDHPVATSLPQVVVADTRIALGKIGAYVKAQTAPKTVGITGSSGKTTVKEMVAAILSRLGNVLATNGNFNNDIGVPLTLLRLTHEHDFAVIEMGANHIGEIAYTTNLVKPDVAIINNIAPAHLEGFGDLCGVARAKGEIFEGIPQGGVAFYNQDSKWAHKWQWRLTDKKVHRFSCADDKSANEVVKAEQTADSYSKNITLDDDGCANFKLHTQIGSTYIQLALPGKHNVCNAVAAAAIAIEFGASLDDVKLGLAEMSPVKGRLNLHQINDNCKLIDDTYNANVESIKAATELLASYPGYRVLILGDMGELGSDARSYHQEVGEHAKAQGIDTLLTLGVLSQSTADAFGDHGQHFSSKEQLLASLKLQLANEARAISILVKGSRSAHMEHVVNEILSWRDTSAVEEHS